MTAGDATTYGATAHGAAGGTAYGSPRGTAHRSPGGTAYGSPSGANSGVNSGVSSGAAHRVLQRRYRRLLLAYPGSYRRRHGSEILTTLMEAAGADRDRPTRREVRDLLAGGLRQRFRLPVGRVMVVVAAVSALIFGAVGAAVGSGLGWVADSPLPDDVALASVGGSVLGEPAEWRPQRWSESFGLRPQALMARTAPDTWTADAARARLAADGWRVGPVTTSGSTALSDDGTTRPADDVTFVAERNGVEVRVVGSLMRQSRSQVVVEARSAEPWPALPLTLAGLVAGLIGGWLFAGRIAYRTRRLPLWARMASMVAATVAAAGLGMSTPQVLLAVGRMLTPADDTERFYEFPPFAVYHVDTALDPLLLVGVAALALLVALAYTVKPRPTVTRPAFGAPA